MHDKSADSFNPACLGHAIRRLRLSSGMSQKSLASQIGVSYQQVQKYEYGRSEVTVTRLWQIARALEVPVEALLGADKAREAPQGITGGRLEARLIRVFRTIKGDALKQEALRMLTAFSTAASRRA